MRVLVTGATGKVGQALIRRILRDETLSGVEIRALTHNRSIEETPRLSAIRGSVGDRQTCREALSGITHVVHLATCKETPESIMDVAVKGMFWLLEEFRQSCTAERFLLVGGDAAVGHFFVRHDGPVTEETAHRAYPGCYALSKVLEEVMLRQVGLQYDIDWCCLRAPWIMEKDDFRYSLSFGDDVFGGPDWSELVGAEAAAECRRAGAVPLLLDEDGAAVRRNFVHVDDLVEAIVIALRAGAARQRLYNICMDEPVNYAAVANYLARTRGLPAKEIRGPYFSNWMDNSRAKAELDWRPAYDLEALIEAAWSYQRPANEPRQIWYPG
ncbi:MAG: NAD-dependent epimerase/dehydratase family protein [Kiloniellaceae bacterium]